MRYWKGVLAALGVGGLVVWGTWTYLDRVNSENSQSPLALIDRLEKDGVPDFELLTVPDGKPFRLSSLKGKTIVLNFWATWCAPCVEEFPAFVRMVKALKGKAVLVTVASDERREDVVNFLKTFKVSGDGIVNVWDNSRKTSEAYGIVRLPETYIVDKNLKLYRKISNAQKWDSPEAIQFLSSIPER